MERKNVAAFTEATSESYPAFVSINREKDGRYTISARERGHGGEKQVVMEIPLAALQAFALGLQRNVTL